MTGLLVLLSIILITIIVVQVGRVTELAAKIRGEEEVQELSNNRNAIFSLLFVIVFLVACVVSAYYYKNYMLGYGPHKAASVHGASIDNLFNVTLFFTGIVFVLTQILLFYFAFRYKAEKGRKALYMPHNNLLEIFWTAIPAVVMAYLVMGGLEVWNDVMGDIEPGEEHMEIEATGYQFAWDLRYPGADGLLGEKNFRLINPANNPLGQDWTDEKNIDDMHVSEIVLPVNKTVRVRITAKDVLHNFYLPHFRVKMDAIPGLPTYFVFTPTKTTEEYRLELKNYPEYQVPDPNDPEKQLWETFNYELACAELCGRGHYSMRRPVRIVSQGEYDSWLKEQSSYYLTTIRGTDDDPFKDRLLDFEIEERRQEFDTKVSGVMSSESPTDTVLTFDYVNFETGSAKLTALSRYELDNLLAFMKKNSAVTVELSGHTDSTGDFDANMELSENRAIAVLDYLKVNGISEDRMVARGYGSTQPIDTNDTEDGRLNNRRTAFRLTAI